ncbi:glycerophosphodiester phosphodiesterase [Brachybacterium avium]|uniref:Glycerophosphodiester phosphodiesterase n=1 Tax=Brachybacterium avium TaxID=2017485 RepID=A0A220U9V9_9MICO|nr:glycerophosphoryl diester phosphodiesterase membrane domain-containing protein [Brachybacterium avium]ASK64918.1 glycerophosphodiester phosphodiesterase [Brachybacterium avium]
MSTSWTAPGSTAGEDPPPSAGPGGDPFGQSPGIDAPDGGRYPGGPRRELMQSMPLFPLRPLGLGEVLGAAVRIYRLRARSVLGVAAAVYGIAFVVLTFVTGASMVPMLGDMQAVFEDPEAVTGTPGFSTAADAVLMILSSAVTMIVTLVASSLVTVALTQVALGEAVGRHISTAQMWGSMRRRGLPAVAVGLLIGVLSLVAFLVLCGLGMLPVILLREASWLTVVPLVLGVLLGVLAVFWIWARTVLAIPSLVLEDVGVFGAIRRSLALTRGRRLWRVLGTAVLLYLIYTFAVQLIASVFGIVAFIVYLVILLASALEGIVLGMIALTVISMVGSYVATFLLAPFLSAGFVAIYADSRMRHEAWDVELLRRAREAWDGDGVR